MNSFMNSSICVSQMISVEYMRQPQNILQNAYLRGVGPLTTHSKVQRVINKLFRICAQVKTDGNGRRGFDPGPSNI